MRTQLIEANIIKKDGKINASNHFIFKRMPHLLVVLEDLTNFLPKDSSRYERLYNVANNLTHRSKCNICGCPTKFLGGHAYSKWCTEKCKNEFFKIKNTKINPETGISINQQRGRTSASKRNKINPITGLTFYKESGKRGSIKRKKINPLTGLSNYEEVFSKSASKIRNSKEKSGRWIPLDKKSDYELYKRSVRMVMSKMPWQNLPNAHLQGRADKNNLNAHHLDHKFSMKEGFIRNIPPFIIGHISNLRFIPWKENVKKCFKCSITEQELFDNFHFSIVTPNDCNKT